MKNIIIDSDVCNETDDPFAISYALTSNKLKVLAITICPFKINFRSISIFDGVIDSFNEALRLTRLSGKKEVKVFKGAIDFVDNNNWEENTATKNIYDISKKYKNLTIVCLGTLTNIAILLKNHPDLINKLDIIWLGTQNLIVDKFTDSNYTKDKKAFEYVIKSNVKMTILPSYLGKFNSTSLYELKEHVALNPLGKHLFNIIKTNPQKIECRGLKNIYDIVPIAYLENPKNFVKKEIDRNLLLKTETKMKTKSTLTYVYDDIGNNQVWLGFLDSIKNAPSNIFKSKFFFTSDTHFSQKDKRRTKENKIAETIEEMDHEYIKRWNSQVGKNDEVFHLGDFGDYNIIKKLNGKVTLICGNYEKRDYADDFPSFREKLINLGFKDVIKNNLILDEKFFGKKVNLTHKPSETITDMFNLFGHVHSLKPVMRNGFNVCCEYHNYTPVSQECIKDYIIFIENYADDEVMKP